MSNIMNDLAFETIQDFVPAPLLRAMKEKGMSEFDILSHFTNGGETPVDMTLIDMFGEGGAEEITEKYLEHCACCHADGSMFTHDHCTVKEEK